MILFQTSTIASGGNRDRDESGSGGGDGNRDKNEEISAVCGEIRGVFPRDFTTYDQLNTTLIVGRFQNKFPIAMVQIKKKPEGEKDECPVINFGDRSIPACAILMFMRMIKWPLYLRYIIWSIMSI